MSETISRRRALQAAGWAACSLFTATVAAQQQRRVTAAEIMGPFYPIKRPLDEDADLTRIRGRAGVAQGTQLDLAGRIVDTKGKPIADARVEMWQANTHGRYDHRSDPNVAAPKDPFFQGFGHQHTDRDGRFRFLTIIPGAYPVVDGEESWLRTPHIHFDIRGRHDRLVTQIYFQGEPLNDTDRLYQALSAADRETVTLTTRDMGSGRPREAGWTVVLASG